MLSSHQRYGFEKGKRYHFVDSLRGVAALLVVFYHIIGAFDHESLRWLPHWMYAALKSGHIGVDIFFVISGFVIAMSLDVRSEHFSYGRFIVRRSLRLDPPYFMTIIAALLLMLLSNQLFPEFCKPLPSWPQIASHLLYLQNLLGYGDIVSVFWTLCFEFQFYLFFAGLLWLGTRFEDRGFLPDDNYRSWILSGWFAALYLASLYFFYLTRGVVPGGIFFEYWFQFFMGISVYWTVTSRMHFFSLLMVWGAAFVFFLISGKSPTKLTSLIVSVALYLDCRSGFFSRWLVSRWILFLGMISYSLYLLHPIIGWRVVSVSKKFLGEGMPPVTSAIVFMAAVAVSVVAAYVFYRLIEKPSIHLSKRVFVQTKA